MYAFVDTNLLLHYPRPDQLDWRVQTGSADITVMIAPVVIRELNRHKDKPESRKLRDRAASVLKWLGGFIDAPDRSLRDDAKLLILGHDPILDFTVNRLNRDLNDDWLIASMLEFRIENPASTVILFTEDQGLRAKARAHRLMTRQLPEELRLPDEVDPLEKKLVETENELRRLRQRIPDLRLQFHDGSDHFRVLLRVSPRMTQVELAARMAEIKKKHPKMPEQGPPSGLLLMGILNETSGDYNRLIEEFYVDYEKYLTQLDDVKFIRQSATKLEIEVSNSGSVPGEDIEIFMHFPDGVDVYDEDTIKAAIRDPAEPESPLEAAQRRLFPSIKIPSSLFLSNQVPLIPSIHSNVSGWSVKKSNSYEVRNHVRKLTHNLCQGLDTLFVVFQAEKPVKSFSIDYELIAANVPEKVPGKLHVIAEVE